MDLSGPNIIETERLKLREYNHEISKIVFESFSDNEIMNFFGLKTAAQLQLEHEMYERGMTMFGKSFCLFHIIEKSTNIVMGWCGYHTLYTRHSRAELGYLLHDDIYKRKGYMKEALNPVIKFGFEKLNLNRIEAFISAENIPSYRLLVNNGFIKEGTLRKHYFSNGNYEDSDIYSLLKTEYTINS